MAIPTGAEVKAFLEGYGISDSVLTDAWIESRRDGFTVPAIKRILGYNFVDGESVTEYLSGSGENILVLSRRPISSLTSLSYTNATDVTGNLVNAVVVNADEGILIARSTTSDGVMGNGIFRKGVQNIKAVYTMSALTNELKELLTYQLAKECLILVSNRTGGGDLNTQGHGRSFGSRGKYTHIMNWLDQKSAEIISHYSTGIVGA